MKEKKLLWIEDDYIELKPLISQLIKAGFTFDCVKNEVEAKEILDRSSYDLIILDIIIPEGIYYKEREPELNVGVRLLKYMVNIKKIKIPIIVLSVISDENVKLEIRKMGVNKFINKGRILPSELKRIVENVLEGKS